LWLISLLRRNLSRGSRGGEPEIPALFLVRRELGGEEFARDRVHLQFQFLVLLRNFSFWVALGEKLASKAANLLVFEWAVA
jgi:hypothetical protein